MPNIEIHGLGAESGRKVRKKIFELFQGAAYLDEIVVTRCPTTVVDTKGQIQPYLRLCSTPADYLDDAIKRLQQLGMDLEIIQLQSFHAKKT